MWLLFAAIADVEQWKGPGTTGGAGELGPYQITENYWKDARMPAGKFQDCEDAAYSRKVMLRYWMRFCPKALREHDYRTLAAVHHHGPSGRTMMIFPDDYVERAMNIINDRRQSKR